VAIAGKVASGLGSGVYGEVGGPFHEEGLSELNVLSGGVVGTTNMQYGLGVSGSSESGTGVLAFSRSGVGLSATSLNGTAISASSTADGYDAITATTTSSKHAAIAGHNTNTSGSLASSEAIVDRPLALIEPRFAIHELAPEWPRATQVTH
jgi:hypothetical protein